MPSDRKPPLLLAEDEEDDIAIITQAIQKVNFEFAVEVVRNGEDAMHYLAGEGPFADRERFPLPFLILLDLKMPGWNGYEFLQWYHFRPDLHHIPVVVLTSSGMDDDVIKVHALGAKSFLLKPTDFPSMQELMRLLMQYWELLKNTVVIQRENPE